MGRCPCVAAHVLLAETVGNTFFTMGRNNGMLADPPAKVSSSPQIQLTETAVPMLPGPPNGSRCGS
eukprot:11573176-Alexandrium_andersonii.AAC.1